MVIQMSCALCRKNYNGVKPELAGKLVKCKCGATMTVPSIQADPLMGELPPVEANHVTNQPLANSQRPP